MIKSIRAHLLLGLILFLVSCASGRSTHTESGLDREPILPATQSQLDSTDNGEFLWGVWEGTISADRTSVELVPARNGDNYNGHYNVLLWLEYGPCYDCVKIIDKKIIGPNKLDLTVQIRHPFFGMPQFTGFDVYGGIQFPYTTLVTKGMSNGYAEFAIAWRFDGAPQVLNPDGYAGGFSYEDHWGKPWNACIPGKLGGVPVDIPGDQIYLLWAYRLFRTTPVRNMFETHGIVEQTYQLWLPEGQEIKFGYVVVCKWVPPDTTPVIDPATQFPREANMGVYATEVLEVSGPVSSTQDMTIRIRVYYHSCMDVGYGFNKISFGGGEDDVEDSAGFGIVKWTNLELVSDNDSGSVMEPSYNEYLLTFERWPDGPDKCPPGTYPYCINPRLTCYSNSIHPNDGYAIFEIECAD
jgi:hypothetical protein